MFGVLIPLCRADLAGYSSLTLSIIPPNLKVRYSHASCTRVGTGTISHKQFAYLDPLLLPKKNRFFAPAITVMERHPGLGCRTGCMVI